MAAATPLFGRPVARAFGPVILLVAALVGGPDAARASGRTPVRSVDVLPGDPLYRELRLAAALGLLPEVPHGDEPLSRAEIHRLLAPLDVDDAGPFASRLSRARAGVASWRRYREPGGARTLVDFSPLRSLELSGSRIRDGTRALRPLATGSDRTEGLAFEQEGSATLEESELTFHLDARFRVDRDEPEWRPLAFLVLTEVHGARFTLGREPLSWGPAVHGNLLLTNNARPLDLLRIASASSFRLPGRLRETGAWRVALFTGHLDDPDRTDVQGPWLSGMRVTVSPSRWLVVGATRTMMLGGIGNRFRFGPFSVLDLFTGAAENRLRENDTDQKASLEGSLWLGPLLRRVPGLRGGRLYAEYGGDDGLRGFPPLPASVAVLLGTELVAGSALARVEVARNEDDSNLWYWHYIYTQGYTTRGKVMGHPMGGDSRSLHADVELTAGGWGLLTASWWRVQHGFETYPGVSPRLVDPPVPHAEYDAVALRVEKFWGPFPGAVTAEIRWTDGRGDVDTFAATERWGGDVAWRRAVW